VSDPITYASLYATPDNETHFRTVQVQLDLIENFAVPTQPLYIGGTLPAVRAFLLAFPPKWGESDLRQDTWHPTPARQIATVLRGHIITYASDGTTHDMGPGGTILMEDLAPAKGHITIKMSADASCVAQVIQL
jgi:hypothetical protein